MIILFSISPSFALGEDNRNYLLIGLLGISPFLTLLNGHIYRNHAPLIIFMVSIVMIPLIANPESIRWSTVIYMQMFCFTYLYYDQLLREDSLTPQFFEKTILYLLYAYFIVLLIQQFCVLFGLPIFNVSNYSSVEPWKLNSLSAEPSHTARIVALLMFCYLSIAQICKSRKYDFRIDLYTDKYLWLGFIWTMLSMHSATAFLFLPIVLLKVVNKSNIALLTAISLLILTIIILSGIDSYERVFNLIVAVASLDFNAALHADHSGAMRIAPMMVLTSMVDTYSWSGLFGHGIDTVGSFMSSYIIGTKEGLAGGGLLRMWYEYGFIILVLYLIFTIDRTNSIRQPINFIFWVLLIFLTGVNNQISWLCIILLSSIRYFESQNDIPLQESNADDE